MYPSWHGMLAHSKWAPTGSRCSRYPWNSTKPGCCKSFEYVRKHGLRQYLVSRRWVLQYEVKTRIGLFFWLGDRIQFRIVRSFHSIPRASGTWSSESSPEPTWCLQMCFRSLVSTCWRATWRCHGMNALVLRNSVGRRTLKSRVCPEFQSLVSLVLTQTMKLWTSKPRSHEPSPPKT